ncbi:MAG: hypothetical protein ACTIL2_14580 [Corynebacterium sp.]|uniref:hypothetical protein n=1 Tax=Corynebacterium sp. TaxID=1720 RepID=UPI003F9DD8A8
MSSPHSDDQQRRRRRLIISLTATGLVIAVLAGIGIYGLITGPRDADDPGNHTPNSSTAPVDPTDPNGHPEETELPVLPRTNSPETYVRAVAAALFDWDTFTLLTPSDHRAVLIEDADPTGTETPGLISDLDGYFPSASTWRDLAEYRTRQHLQIDRIYIPEQWEEAVAASGGQITEGTIAYTVEGIRHRDGVWYDDPVESSHAVAFTVFVSCEPVFDRCHLLRLSELDNPLR